MPNGLALSGRIVKALPDLLGVLRDGVGASLDDGLLLLLWDGLVILDDLPQLGDQRHRTDGITVGRLLLLQHEAQEDATVVDGQVEGLVHEHVTKIDVRKFLGWWLLDVCFQFAVGVALGDHAVGQKLADLPDDSFVGFEDVLGLRDFGLWLGKGAWVLYVVLVFDLVVDLLMLYWAILYLGLLDCLKFLFLRDLEDVLFYHIFCLLFMMVYRLLLLLMFWRFLFLVIFCGFLILLMYYWWLLLRIFRNLLLNTRLFQSP